MNIDAIKNALSSSRSLRLTYENVSDTNILSTSSFIYDVGGLKNTQQLNVDWSRFENHTFFMSAVAKVNIAFDQIINQYPFDGSRSDIEKFFENLTGWDKWVYDSYPKYHGALQFSNSWINVVDAAGVTYPQISKNRSGASILNPIDSSLTIEFHLNVPKQSNDTQFICQKLSSDSNSGFNVYLLPSTSSTECDVGFSVVSGSNHLTTTARISKGNFNHLAAILNRDEGVHYVNIISNAVSSSHSNNSTNIGFLNIDSSNLLIGSGATFYLASSPVSASTTLSGTLDEFRIFHSARSLTQIKQYAKRNVYVTDDLKLYYKFNEPQISSTHNQVIDSSGMSLHSYVNNFSTNLRVSSSIDETNLMIYENSTLNPILFPSHNDVISFNNELIMSASEYDIDNPNIITKLIPTHYLVAGAASEGLTEGTTTPNLESADKGDSLKGESQVLLTFLYLYARFFDELKLFVDSFRALKYVGYNDFDTVPDNFLNDFVKRTGMNLPSFFNDSTIEQYIRAENIDQDISTSLLALKNVQSQLMRRVLINMPEIIRSKGTQHSIRAFLRAAGIDPNNVFRIREYGGPTTRNLKFSREKRLDVGTMTKFTTSSYATSTFLSSSRVEPGFPTIAGTFVNGVSNNKSDGLLTSGSWSLELNVKWNPSERLTSATQSLARIAVTGSSGNTEGIIANLLAISSSIEPKVILYVKSGVSASSPQLKMELATPIYDGLFSGEKWNISFGRNRNEHVSSSYFLRVGTQNDGDVNWFATTSSYFLETNSNEFDVFKKIDSKNTSGAYLVFGEGRPINTSYSSFLNASDATATTTAFTGLLSDLKFWSYGLETKEWLEHIRNRDSVGVLNPHVNFNFGTAESGSFQRLRLHSLIKQNEKSSTNGDITFLDFSQNNNHLLGKQFDETVMYGELFQKSYLSPYFDEGTCDEKIRVRGFLSLDNVNNDNLAQPGPVYEVLKSEQPNDDVRLSIDISLVDALNRDIVSMFATFDELDNALGAPELIFSEDYPALDHLRTLYFNRLSERLNFKLFFEFYSWFDTSISKFIEQLIPQKTNFRGTNFVVESHMLERHRINYPQNDIYLADSDRNSIEDRLLLQQITGLIWRF